MNKKFAIGAFSVFLFLTLLTPFWVFKDLLFPFVTSKAFYLRIAIELAFPFYVYLVLKYPQYRPSLKNPLTVSMLAFLVINLVAGMFGVNPLRSLWGNFERMGGVFYTAHLVLLYFFVLILGQISTRLLRGFLQALLAIGAIVSFDGLMVWVTKNHFLLNDPSYPRVSGTFGNPIFIASFLIVPMFIAAFFAFGETTLWKRLWYWFLVLLQLTVIFISGTRGAVVGLGIGIFLLAAAYVFLTPSKKIRLWGGGAVVIFAAALLLLFSFHNDLPKGTMLSRVFNLRDSNTEARLIQWGVALKGVRQKPILGYGPEDYYVVSNQFYNPEIFKYDPSWFDKPHNYLIEVLVTSGVFGFAAYAGILLFSVWAFWRAYKKGVLLLEEFCVLTCALIVYEIQNLFVFDTVAASMAFFAFCGLAAYLWHESRDEAAQPASKKAAAMPGQFPLVVFGIASVVVIYSLYVFNIVGMEAGKAVNYGYAYGSVDPNQSEAYFQRAFNVPFNFDPIQSASKYAEFASALAGSNQSPDLVKTELEHAIDAEKKAIGIVPNDPTAWQQLSNLYLNLSVVNKTAIPQEAFDAAKTAMQLAPKRPEPQIALAQLQLYANDVSGARATLEDEVKNIPLNYNAKMQLALIYYFTNDKEKAVQLAESVLATGYIPRQAREVEWLGQYYMDKKDINNSIRIYSLAVQADPNNVNDYFALAQAYAMGGQKDKALQIARALLQTNPANAAQIQQFIDSLQK